MPALFAKPAPPSEDKRWKIVETRMRRMGDRPSALIEALHAAQEAFGYLDDDALNYVGDTLGVPHSRVYGVATFYSFFTLKPQGEHTCVVCTGTACYINGAKDILAGLEARPGREAQGDDAGRQAVAADGPLPRRVQPRARRDRRRRRQGQGQHRRPDRRPGGDVSEIGGGAPVPRRALRKVLKEIAKPDAAPPRRASAYVCEAASCMSAQAHDITLRLSEAVTAAGLDRHRGQARRLPRPVRGRTARRDPRDRRPVRPHAPGRRRTGSSMSCGPCRPARRPQPQGPFFEKQYRVATENMGRIDPESLDDYLGRGGYEALKTVLSEMSSTEVREVITQSGLRGRGGAGYPTGLKWTTVAKAPGTQKYVICNADEGDPGAFMDRSVLESDPFRVLEGMAIAAYAVHATEGYIYCRAEYPLAVQRLRTAIRSGAAGRLAGQQHRRHLVQLRHRDPPRRRRLRLRRGDGADRSRSRASAARRARARRTRPSSGLFGCPTLINNVETFANVPPILRKGARVVRGDRHRQEQGDQGLRARRPDREHGPRRGPDGHDAARDHLRHRRRHPRRAAVQGRPDRRPVRRLHPGRAPRHAGRLRVADRARLDHGLGRHDRHGRHVVHGGRRPLLHGLLPSTSRAASASRAGWAPPSCWMLLDKICRGTGRHDRPRPAGASRGRRPQA